MKNITICTIAALALAGCITQPSAALDDPAPETAAAPVAEEYRYEDFDELRGGRSS